MEARKSESMVWHLVKGSVLHNNMAQRQARTHQSEKGRVETQLIHLSSAHSQYNIINASMVLDTSQWSLLFRCTSAILIQFQHGFWREHSNHINKWILKEKELIQRQWCIEGKLSTVTSSAFTDENLIAFLLIMVSIHCIILSSYSIPV